MGFLEMLEESVSTDSDEDSLQVGRKKTDYKVGDIVRWCWSEQHRSTYYILIVDDKSVLLKQNFGMGQTLTGKVPISEIELDY